LTLSHAKPTDLRSALRDADWEELLPSLLVYAARRLRRAGWAAGRDEEASKMSVEQLVQTAVQHCLDGTRRWDSSAVDLPGLLRGVIRSLTSSERKKFVRTKTLTSSETIECRADTVDSPEDDVIEEESRAEFLRVVEACTSGDPDLEALYLAIVDGNTKREDIAAALAWDADRVTAARMKLQRRLVREAPALFVPVVERGRRMS
jgi:hypothetical protein